MTKRIKNNVAKRNQVKPADGKNENEDNSVHSISKANKEGNLPRKG